MKQVQQNKAEEGIAHIGLIILVVAVLAAITFSAWWVWNKNKISGQKTNLSNNGQQNGAEQEEQTEDDIAIPAGWKQYKNSGAGFSFYYPPGWGEVKSQDNQYIFSGFPGVSFQVNRRDKQHDPVELGVKDDNVIDVRSVGSSAKVIFVTGIDPPTEEEIFDSGNVVKQLAESRACVIDDVYPYELEPDPDAINRHIYLGLCGLLNSTYGAFTFNSNGLDVTKPETKKIKEELVQSLQTFVAF